MSKNSTTISDEKNRLESQQVNRTYSKSNRKFGIIKEVHEKYFAVTVLLNEGGLALNGTFLPITNSWQELIHDYGNLRPGMLVKVSFIGNQESIAEVEVIGLEGEKVGQLQEKPEVNLSLYEIYSPGI